jgi:hypothetical protein
MCFALHSGLFMGQGLFVKLGMLEGKWQYQQKVLNVKPGLGF